MVAQYPPHGSFLYERLEEGLAELEAQLQRHGAVDALLGFSQARTLRVSCLDMIASDLLGCSRAACAVSPPLSVQKICTLSAD